MIEIHENIYGHRNRVDWFTNFIKKEDEILEFGCGTGVMVSAYLLQKGYNMYGVDLDEPSIELGRKIYLEHGLEPNRLICSDIADLEDARFDVIIATEVFEHIYKKDIDSVIELIKTKLKPGGKLIVTVPNGYGWFEFESLFWKGLGIGWILQKLYITKVIYAVKERILGWKYNKLTSTIAHSPHVRRFTMKSVSNLVGSHDFEIKARRGSVFFAGGFSSLIFGGWPWFTRFNIKLGEWFPSCASGFYLCAEMK